jgi:hypothetical protein
MSTLEEATLCLISRREMITMVQGGAGGQAEATLKAGFMTDSKCRNKRQSGFNHQMMEFFHQPLHRLCGVHLSSQHLRAEQEDHAFEASLGI